MTIPPRCTAAAMVMWALGCGQSHEAVDARVLDRGDSGGRDAARDAERDVRGDARAGEPGVGELCYLFNAPLPLYPDEVYLETETSACRTGVCVGYHLDGDPRAGCTDGCADPNRVFCSCRCGAPSGVATCECSSGYRCQELIMRGGPDFDGSYCVPDALEE